jgi:hypothetical protein
MIRPRDAAIGRSVATAENQVRSLIFPAFQAFFWETLPKLPTGNPLCLNTPIGRAEGAWCQKNPKVRGPARKRLARALGV